MACFFGIQLGSAGELIPRLDCSDSGVERYWSLGVSLRRRGSTNLRLRVSVHQNRLRSLRSGRDDGEAVLEIVDISLTLALSRWERG